MGQSRRSRRPLIEPYGIEILVKGLVVEGRFEPLIEPYGIEIKVSDNTQIGKHDL